MQLAIIVAVAATLASPCPDCDSGSCVVNDDGTATCYAHCKKRCGEVVRHGWKGYDDGDNACNVCECNDGVLGCTKVKCPDVPCPDEVCKGNAVCGGITGASCNSRSHVCIDNPADSCDPDEGDADCIGCCVFDECQRTVCKAGYVCELNWFGQAECVHPCSKIECKEGSTCQLNADGKPVCYESCKKTCGDIVPHGWGGFDDGSNACNQCGCSDGSMICTMMACPDVPCPADVCKDTTKCGGITGALCPNRNQVCIDNPADACNPDKGGADCIGCCVFDACMQTICDKGKVCKLDWLGQAQCVTVFLDPCDLVKCVQGTTCHVTADGGAACLKDCKMTCGTVVPHGWSGYDEGNNACNICTCNDGGMSCTKRACLDVPCPADVCKGATKCGGITGASCLSRTQACIDDPSDNCNPDKGGADCIGCCVFDECLQTVCKEGYACELNWFGQAQCVEQDPCSKIECEDGTCFLNDDGKPVCYKNCKKRCGEVVPHGWGGFDDGDNACNRCGCLNGGLICTKMACPDVPCPNEVCKGMTACAGKTGASCLNRNQVCIDDPADDCDPAEGGADCIGCCLFDACMLVACAKGYVCELNWFGKAECVKQDPVCCLAVPTCPDGHSEVKTCTDKEFADGVCVGVTKCCSTITCRDDTAAFGNDSE